VYADVLWCVDFWPNSSSNRAATRPEQRLAYFEAAATALDRRLATLAPTLPQHHAVLDLPGIGLFTALLIIGEL
jgi:hypothetical protein